MELFYQVMKPSANHSNQMFNKLSERRRPNQNNRKRLKLPFTLLILIPFTNHCLWLSTSIHYTSDLNGYARLPEDIQTLLIRVSDENSKELVGDTLANVECTQPVGSFAQVTFPISDIYKRREMWNGKISQTARNAIRKIIPNVIFKADYCTTLETKEQFFLTESELNLKIQNQTRYLPPGCVLTRNINQRRAVVRSQFSETCGKIPDYSHVKSLTSRELDLISNGKVIIEIEDDRNPTGKGYNMELVISAIKHFVSLGIIPLHSKFEAFARLKSSDGYSNRILIYQGELTKSIWNYFLFPLWLVRSDSKIRLDGPFSERPADSISFDDYFYHDMIQILTAYELSSRLEYSK
ncbi:hypothetical protein KQY10_07535 [Leptospira interrogans]|uniref:Uncharacterized protein n=3 Tax=Leptospira interrogans TaxID=173 RepID=A0AAP9WBY5_LEPIR|nr:hypothetical protein [Leptospira interrogans]MBM2889181.1 hypothetical protein [Leptospira interrogans]MCD1165460.1 hypothetical protein [Leptospira interrogans]MCH1886276.1 hypothetical protein [Leptospira interrogans]MCH1892541.1 hypothetical protein [Leptospira interrogans]MCH1899374.1 hypothetical protein [Leptospira interrogans]